MNLEAMLARQQELVDVAKKAGRDLNEEEKREFDELTTAIRNYEKSEEPTSGEERQKGIQEERQRVADISQLCRDFETEAEGYIKDGSTVDAVRAAILDKLRKENGPIDQRGRADVTVDEQDKFVRAAADAMVMRGGVEIEKPEEGARSLMGMGLRDLAIECLERSGDGQNMSRRSADDVYQTLISQRAYFNPTNAFPAIMDAAINKAYVEGHRTVAVTFDKWTKKGTLKDFKTHDNNYLAGPAGKFMEVKEGGELVHDTPKDAKRPARKLKTYGRQFTMSRQAFINDDIDFLSKVPAKYAASARKTQNTQCYEIMVGNPAIYDGKKLFDKDIHKNVLAKGTGITKEAVQTMFMALQMQKDEFGEAIIVRPAYIIVPIGYGFEMYELFWSPVVNTSGNTQAVNPLYRYKESIEVIEDPTLNALGGDGAIPWFLIGDKSDTDFVEVDYLNGNEIPQIRRMETPGQLGFVWDVYLDWGITVMDWRGAVMNPGIKIKAPLE